MTKFLAILKDSLLESIDARVFYVMLALSALVIAVAASASFSPKPGGKMVMEMAAAPLSVDLSNLTRAEVEGAREDPTQMLRRLRGAYKVVSVSAEGGADDLPGSTFSVVIQSGGLGGLGGGGLGELLRGITRPAEGPGAGGASEKVIAQIRERFGAFDEVRVAEVLDVVKEKGPFYSIKARVTEQGRRLWPHDFRLFFGNLVVLEEGVPLGAQLYVIQGWIIGSVGSWVTLLVSVILTAYFIPNMLRKGTIDLLLVKPIHRATLLLCKYLGGLLFILINTAVAVTGVWLVFCLLTGIWSPGFLVSIPAFTFYFAILYSVSALFGVLTRSPIVCITVTCLVWFFLWAVGLTNNLTNEVFARQQERKARLHASQFALAAVGSFAHPVPAGLNGVVTANLQLQRLDPMVYAPGWFPKVVRAIHFVLPRTSDLTALTDRHLQEGLLPVPRALRIAATGTREISWGESLTVSGLFIAVMLGLACWRFSVKDY